MTDQSRPSSFTREGRQQAQTRARALVALQQQAAAKPQPQRSHYRADGWLDIANEPVWDWPVPEPPDWASLDQHEQQTYKLACIAYAVAEVARQNEKSPARLMDDWNWGRG